MRLTIAQRLERYSVDDPSGCRLWTGALDNKGYGRVFYKGRNCQASRVALEVAIGRPLARHEHSCHRCDVPACIREEHLYIGTHYTNMRDMVNRGRNRTVFGAGDANRQAKISEDQAVAIILDRRPAHIIAPDYGLSVHTVRGIKYRRCWKTARADDARRKLAGNPARNVSKPNECVSLLHGQDHEVSRWKVLHARMRVKAAEHGS